MTIFITQHKEVSHCRPMTSRRTPSCISTAMSMTAQVTPSPEARDLFNNMVAFAQPLEADGNSLLINVGNVLVVGCQRARQGLDAMAEAEIGELVTNRWIKPAPAGGWYLG